MAQPQAQTKEAAPRAAKTLTVVINNREGLVIGQMPHKGRDVSGSPTVGKAVSFLPGLNLVDTDELKILRANEAFELNFTTKIPRSRAPEQSPEKVGELVLEQFEELPIHRPLDKLADARAVELVKETFNLDLLRIFLRDEGRSEIRAALANQIDMMETGGPGAHEAGAR